MTRTVLGIAVALAACSSAPEPVKPPANEPDPTTPSPPANERRGTLSIDAEPGGKRFQGVWFHTDNMKFVLSYRAHDLWTWFAGREVLITGSCYQPFGQAISATHFAVDTLRVAEETRGVGPYFSFGPVQWLIGETVDVDAPAGSKMAGTTRRVFRTEGGTTYELAGGDVPDPGKRVRVEARVLEPDMSYVARTNGPDLWIVESHDPGYQPDPAHADTPGPCPGDDTR